MRTIDPIDRLLKTTEVAALEGMSTRWLAEQVKQNKFPAPDVPAQGRGAPHRWCESTLRKAREARAITAQQSAA